MGKELRADVAELMNQIRAGGHARTEVSKLLADDPEAGLLVLQAYFDDSSDRVRHRAYAMLAQMAQSSQNPYVRQKSVEFLLRRWMIARLSCGSTPLQTCTSFEAVISRLLREPKFGPGFTAISSFQR